jgi:hypothetical protein
MKREKTFQPIAELLNCLLLLNDDQTCSRANIRQMPTFSFCWSFPFYSLRIHWRLVPSKRKTGENHG